MIDEYDVLLDKAFQGGFYDEMLSVIRSMLSIALKTNKSLEFAVLTGCLRIAKESIFTGLNNFKVFSLSDVRFDEDFGFTDEEVKQMLAYYDLSDKFEEIKECYDNYKFENISVYYPWDVIITVKTFWKDDKTLLLAIQNRRKKTFITEYYWDCLHRWGIGWYLPTQNLERDIAIFSSKQRMKLELLLK